MSEVHWGDLEDEQNREDDFNIAPIDLNNFLTLNPTSSFSTNFPTINKEETSKLKILPTEMCRSDPLVMHNIKLVDYCHRVHQHVARYQTYGIDSPVLPIPSLEDPTLEAKLNQSKFLNFIPPDSSTFAKGEGKLPKLDIDQTTARVMLRKAVATLLAHSGFADGKDSVLRLMTDCTHEFFSKITALLRNNTDSMLREDCPQSNSSEIIRRTFHGVGMSNVPVEIHAMYTDIITQNSRMRARTKNLQQMLEDKGRHTGLRSRIDSNTILDEKPILLSQEELSLPASLNMELDQVFKL